MLLALNGMGSALGISDAGSSGERMGEQSGRLDDIHDVGGLVDVLGVKE